MVLLQTWSMREEEEGRNDRLLDAVAGMAQIQVSQPAIWSVLPCPFPRKPTTYPELELQLLHGIRSHVDNQSGLGSCSRKASICSSCFFGQTIRARTGSGSGLASFQIEVPETRSLYK